MTFALVESLARSSARTYLALAPYRSIFGFLNRARVLERVVACDGFLRASNPPLYIVSKRASNPKEQVAKSLSAYY